MQKILELLSNKKIKYSIIGVLVLLFLIIMVGTISKNKSSQEQKPEEPEIIEVNDDLKNDITKEINELSYGYYCSVPSELDFANDCLYRNNTTLKENLNAEYRLSSIILSIGAAKGNNVLVGSIVVDNKAFTNPNYVDLKDVKEEYIKIYGQKDAFNPEMVNNITKYDIKYDSKREKFVYTLPEIDHFATFYLEKINTTTTEVTAYVRVGFIEYKFYRYNLYTERDLKTQIAKYNSVEYKKGKIINEDNFKQFKQYRYTFVKEEETNNLIFKQIDLIG